jgi:hypothetical protein
MHADVVISYKVLHEISRGNMVADFLSSHYIEWFYMSFATG